jgi:ribose transport system permease protein
VRRVLSEIVLIPWAGVLIGLIVVAAAVSAISPYFLTVGNILGNVALYFSWFAIAGFGEALVMIGGGLDLSVGSAMGFSGMIAALALAAGMPLWIGLAAGLAAGAFVGFVNGLVVTRLHLNPFIATLATLGVFRGITYGIVQGQAITPPSNGAGDAFTSLGSGALAGVPSPVIAMLVLALVCFVALNHTKFGRHVYALGGNEGATRLLGLDVRRLKMTLYVISGLTAAVGGILLTARAGTALPDAAEGYELQVIAGVIIGGVSLAGGQGTIPGVLIGAALLGVINNGIVLAGLAGYWQQLITGLVIAAAAALDVLRQRLSYLRAA